MENNKNIEKIDDVGSEKVSGGSLEHAHGGFRVFNSYTGKEYGVLSDYNDAVQMAKKHKVSAMGTWGNKEIPIGLVGTGKTRKDIRKKEDRTHKADAIYGTGSFK